MLLLCSHLISVESFWLYRDFFFFPSPFTRCWTATCPLLWSPRSLLHPSCPSQWSPRPPTSRRPAALATASACEACPTPPASRTSWSSWGSTRSTSNPTACTWSSTSRWGFTATKGLLESIGSQVNTWVALTLYTCVMMIEWSLHTIAERLGKTLWGSVVISWKIRRETETKLLILLSNKSNSILIQIYTSHQRRYRASQVVAGLCSCAFNHLQSQKPVVDSWARVHPPP